jgi:hypothetical protein
VTAAEFKEIRKHLKLSCRQLSEVFFKNVTTIQRYDDDRVPVPKMIAKAMREMLAKATVDQTRPQLLDIALRLIKSPTDIETFITKLNTL